MNPVEKQRLVDRARWILEEHLRRREPPSPWQGDMRSDHDELDDAIAQALAGDSGAITTLRRVFHEPGFATTNSGHEQGLAALGLALLGDRESLPRIRKVLSINLNREAKPLALAILDAPSGSEPV